MVGMRGNGALGSSNGEPFKKPMTPYMCFLKEQTDLLSQS